MFIKKSNTGFAIVVVYVNDMNLIRTLEELTKTTEYLKKEFKVKDLGKNQIMSCLELEYKTNEILVHQSAYTKMILERFSMDKTHPLSTPIIVRTFEPIKIYSDLKNLMKRYLVLKYHISMQLCFNVLGTVHKTRYRICDKSVGMS